MIGGKKVWLGFMLLLVSAMLIPQVAAAQGGVAPAAPQAALGQTLPDSTLQDLNGKDSNTVLLSDFGNGERYKYYQVNQPSISTDPYPHTQTNYLSITDNGNTLLVTQNGNSGTENVQTASPTSSPGTYNTGSLNSNTFGNVMGVVGVVKVGR
jgi:hypothetical protein